MPQMRPKNGYGRLIMLESQTPGFIDGCVCSENETFLCEAEKKTTDNAFMLLVRHMRYALIVSLKASVIFCRSFNLHAALALFFPVCPAYACLTKASVFYIMQKTVGKISVIPDMKE